jgi:hypothetical protein
MSNSLAIDINEMRNSNKFLCDPLTNGAKGAKEYNVVFKRHLFIIKFRKSILQLYKYLKLFN